MSTARPTPLSTLGCAMNRPGPRAAHRTAAAAMLAAALALATACSSSQAATARGTAVPNPSTETRTATAPLPHPDHVVVVVMENHSYADILGSSSAPYLNALAAQGASFSRSYAITHPSEPNYLALFSGSTAGLGDDSCPHTYTGPNLASDTGCTAGEYARRHNPWVDFTNVPAADNRTFADFPSDYAKLPTVSFVVPNLIDDMHDGTIAQGDAWLRSNIDGYAQWAKTHDSELVITWDEDDNSAGDQIPTLIVGAGVHRGTYGEPISHYTVLRTIEDFFRLPHAAESASATPISDIFGG